MLIILFLLTMYYVVYIETCSDETEAYCRTVEYDYDVEEVIIVLCY